jgi:hypothetical protein
MGMKIAESRMTMMQSSNRTNSPVTFNDLVNPNGSAAGTLVVIKIPVTR